MLEHVQAEIASSRQSRRPWHLLHKPPLLALLLLMVLYLLSPLLTSTHVENFTAQIEIGAIAANAKQLDQANLLYPLHAEFFYLTRLGVVFLLQALMRVVGTGDIAFRILTAASFLLFAGTTLAVARRHAQAGLPALIAALLLTPGLAELGFYFNDNVVSASLGMLGLLLLPRADGHGARDRLAWTIRGLLAGAALGSAIIARPDALLLLPVAAGLSWLETGRWPKLVALGALVSVGILVAFAASYAASGATIIDALQIGRYFNDMQAKFRHYSVTAAVLLLFFGLPNLVLLPLGAWQVLRGGDLKRVLVLVGLPLLLLAYMGRSATQTRHFYPLLAPFVVMHGARGLAWIATALTAGGMQRRWAVLWLAGTAAVWLAPPVLVPVADGPRAVVGRLWSPLLWFRWGAAMSDTLEAAVGLAEPPSQVHRTVVLTTNFDPDHFLRLRLWQHGWQASPAAAAWPGCNGGFEAWRRGGQEFDHVRTENPHLSAREPGGYVEALQIHQAFKCPGLFQDAAMYAFDTGPHYFDSDIMRLLYKDVPSLAPTAISYGWPGAVAGGILAHLTPWELGIFPHVTYLGHVAPLTPGQVGEVSQAAEGIVAAYVSSEGAALPGYDPFMAAFQRGAWRVSSKRVEH
jgi:hypothetical protein